MIVLRVSSTFPATAWQKATIEFRCGVFPGHCLSTTPPCHSTDTGNYTACQGPERSLFSHPQVVCPSTGALKAWDLPTDYCFNDNFFWITQFLGCFEGKARSKKNGFPGDLNSSNGGVIRDVAGKRYTRTRGQTCGTKRFDQIFLGTKGNKNQQQLVAWIVEVFWICCNP